MSSDNEILALEDKRYAAMCSGDFAALEAMLHDELLYTHSSGLTDTKATWLASLRSGKTRDKSAACSDRNVRLVGDTALVPGRAAIEGEINGQPRMSGRFPSASTSVLVDEEIIVLGFQMRDTAVAVFEHLRAHVFID